MAAKGIYETVKQAIQDVVAPDLERIKGQLAGARSELKAELTAVRGEVKAVDDRIASLRNEMHAELRTVSARIDALKDRLDEALNIRERLATLEAKVAARG